MRRWLRHTNVFESSRHIFGAEAAPRKAAELFPPLFARSWSTSDLQLRPSVIVIGGLAPEEYNYWLLHKALHEEGDFHVRPLRYDGLSRSLAELGAEAAQVIRDHKSHTGRCATHFVTHSFGALVLRQALAELDWDDQRSRIVMLAPPNRGSLFARRLHRMRLAPIMLGNAAGLELAKRGPKYFDNLCAMPRGVRVRVVAGTMGFNPLLGGGASCLNDGRVLVSETWLSSPHERILLPYTHTFMLYRNRTHQAVIDFLKAKSEPKENVEIFT